jgi:hypothetical protein
MRKIFLTLLALTIVVAAWSQKSGDKGVFDNAFYARIGYAFPGGELKDKEAITAGAQFEIGTIFYVRSVKLPEKLKFGIDATFVSISGFENLKMMNDQNKSDSYMRAGFKVGPAISYNFVDKWIADLYVKLHSNQFYTGEDENHGYHANTQKNFGTSVGLNIRWKALMLGYEFNTSQYDFDKIPDGEGFKSGKISLPVSQLTLGVKF